MAGSSPSLTDPVQLIENLSVNDEGSTAAQDLSSILGPVKLAIKLQLHLLPEGEEDGTCITVGQLHGEPFTVKVWREEERVIGRFETGSSWILGETGAAKGNEGETMLSGCLRLW